MSKEVSAFSYGFVFGVVFLAVIEIMTGTAPKAFIDLRKEAIDLGKAEWIMVHDTNKLGAPSVKFQWKK
jgi:hypothetical protein